MDQQKIAKAVKDLLIAIGEDPEREGLAETPQRVAKMYQEVFSSLNNQKKWRTIRPSMLMMCQKWY